MFIKSGLYCILEVDVVNPIMAKDIMATFKINFSQSQGNQTFFIKYKFATK